MADLPMAQIPDFQLHGPQNVPMPGGPFQQLAQGVQSGLDIGLRSQQLAQQQQKIVMEKQQQQFEQGTAIAQNALHAYDTYGDVVGPESLNAFVKGINMAAPGTVDPNLKWDPSMGGAMKTAQDAFDAAQKGERPMNEAMGVIAKAMGTVGKVQKAKMEPLLQSAQNIFDQEQTGKRQEFAQRQDTQRSYAAHAQPLIEAGSILNSIRDNLSKGTPTADAIAKANIEKLVANGSISKDDIERLTKSGGPLEKMGQTWSNWKSGLTFDATHRKAMQEWIPSKVNEINNTLKATASAFPGASAAQVPSRITRTLKSGRTAYSDDGGKTWLYQ